MHGHLCLLNFSFHYSCMTKNLLIDKPILGANLIFSTLYLCYKISTTQKKLSLKRSHFLQQVPWTGKILKLLVNAKRGDHIRILES